LQGSKPRNVGQCVNANGYPGEWTRPHCGDFCASISGATNCGSDEKGANRQSQHRGHNRNSGDLRGWYGGGVRERSNCTKLRYRIPAPQSEKRALPWKEPAHACKPSRPRPGVSGNATPELPPHGVLGCRHTYGQGRMEGSLPTLNLSAPRHRRPEETPRRLKLGSLDGRVDRLAASCSGASTSPIYWSSRCSPLSLLPSQKQPLRPPVQGSKRDCSRSTDH
jgi:hypothetical protein